MIMVIDSLAASVWRASWQAIVLALLVVLLTRVLGESITPRWRYLLLGIVVARLLLVATPPSRWSIFNSVGWANRLDIGNRETARSAYEPAPLEATGVVADTERVPQTDAPRPARDRPAAQVRTSGITVPLAGGVVGAARSDGRPGRSAGVATILSWIWMGGGVLFSWKLLGGALLLRRRLAACRPVTDPAILHLLETARRQMGLRSVPGLLVTPAAISPCVVGPWRPRIILPESLVTESSTDRLGHVLAHELSHVVRGDLWSSWLLVTARIIHWFNPVAWWTVRKMYAEREAACDELAVSMLGEANRSAYASTIIKLAAKRPLSTLVPGLIAMSSSSPNQLKARVERLLRSPAVPKLPASIALCLVAGIGLLGLTDATALQRPAGDEQPSRNAADSKNRPERPGGTYAIRGVCLDHVDGFALAGVQVRLFAARGVDGPAIEVARTMSDPDGRFEFDNLVSPRPYDRFDPLMYDVVAQEPNRPVGVGAWWALGRQFPEASIRMRRVAATLSGRVVNEAGEAVPGAMVAYYRIDGRPLAGVLSATADFAGRFQIEGIPVSPERPGVSIHVIHRDYPRTEFQVDLPRAGDVVMTLPQGCTVTGTVIDGATRLPATGAVVRAETVDAGQGPITVTNEAGQFRMAVSEGRYNFLAEMLDRVCVAATDIECLAGQEVELPRFTMIEGGFIAGFVVDTSTGHPRTRGNNGSDPITIGLFGPSHPKGRVIQQIPFVKVDEQGRFRVRAAPGENFPYFVNVRGDRMAWDTHAQPPVIVTAGETTVYNMPITPPIPSAEKLESARQLVATLSDDPSDRVAQIILEFRKLNHTVDEPELWCTLMRELVAVGADAVPQLCAELDRTTGDRTLRRLAFALRAIADARAVPALVRAIPRTLLPPSSDYGLLIEDAELAAFMQLHDLQDGAGGGMYFDLGRPVRELFGTLHRLTTRDFDDAQLYNMHLSDDPRRAVMQRRMFVAQARRWQAWWDDNWREFTDDAAFRSVDLAVVDQDLPPALASLGRGAQLGDGVTGAIMSPAIEESVHSWHFLDLDTGYRPRWPVHIPKDEQQLDAEQLATWARENGVDLMCVTHVAEDGTPTFVLRAFDMQTWEISPRQLRNLDRSIAAGRLPEGHAVGELLMHYDLDEQEYVPDANAAFIFVTREGNFGVIETTDRVTRTADMAGGYGPPPKGIGFRLGVRFDLKSIVPGDS